MKKIQDTKTLEEFSLLYKNYKILNLQNLNLKFEHYKDEFEYNENLVTSSLKHLDQIIKKEFSNTTPTLEIIYQIVTEGFVAEKKFLGVQINIKRWQEVVKLTNGPDKLQKMLAKLTGINQTHLG
jgi:uncharacterized protein YtpQ (UPF0354 family)